MSQIVVSTEFLLFITNSGYSEHIVYVRTCSIYPEFTVHKFSENAIHWDLMAGKHCWSGSLPGGSWVPGNNSGVFVGKHMYHQKEKKLWEIFAGKYTCRLEHCISCRSFSTTLTLGINDKPRNRLLKPSIFLKYYCALNSTIMPPPWFEQVLRETVNKNWEYSTKYYKILALY